MTRAPSIALLALVGLVASGGARRLEAQLDRAVGVTATRVEHRVDIGSGVEVTSGTLFGGRLGLLRSSWLEVRGSARGGTLSARGVPAEDRTLGEVELDAVVLPFDWLAFRGALDARSYSGRLARQRWISVRTGAEARLDMLDGLVQGHARLGTMPLVSVSGLDAPNLALESGVGLTYRARSLQGELGYSIERYGFPRAATGRRVEQISALTIGLGVRW
jgi:hypothetical protein